MARPSEEHKNLLAQEQSPYLRQHAGNPVFWVPWGDEHLQKAKENNRLILISIGYAACHWCHVMERESFEDDAVAQLMNSHFINIKVDREERPDIDHVYMQALQILTGQGGWPLNIVALPDGRPLWGGTYFPKEQWMAYLTQIVTLHEKNPSKLRRYASDLEKGMLALELEKNKGQKTLELHEIRAAISSFENKIDRTNGGLNGAPKFMMPTLLNLFLRTKELTTHAHLTLEKMALGGLFDLLGGGFSRYSVDERWHVPHFEKMGYDNGQLLEVYCSAYQKTKSPLYREVIEKTLRFLNDELSNQKGGFYASLDADSLSPNGTLEEGAFYVWSKSELEVLGLLNTPYFTDYFGINSQGYWENDCYVFFRPTSIDTFLKEKGLDNAFSKTIADWESTLFKARQQRPAPRRDDKIICAWNALIGKGLLHAFRVFQTESYRDFAQMNLTFIGQTFQRKGKGLYRLNKAEATPVNGFLEDYSCLISYYLDAYETFFEASLLKCVEKLIEYCFENFTQTNSSLFYFSEEENLVIQNQEINDNVIPSSNAMMAENLYRASIHLDKTEWAYRAKTMIETVANDCTQFPRAHSYWLRLALNLSLSQREIVILGPQAIEWIRVLQQYDFENVHWAASTTESPLPLLKHRFKNNNTLIYICENKQCGRPLESLDAAKKVLSIT